MADLKIVSDPQTAEAADATFVRESLALYNMATTGHSYYSPLAIFLRDDRGAVLGGALGHVWRGWPDVLWVSELFRAPLSWAAEATSSLLAG